VIFYSNTPFLLFSKDNAAKEKSIETEIEVRC
jgi:hypothetical protein